MNKMNKSTSAYMIRITRQYYGPKNECTFVRTDDDQRYAIYPTRAAARRKIRKLEAEQYELSHSECSSPIYTLVPMANAPRYAADFGREV